MIDENDTDAGTEIVLPDEITDPTHLGNLTDLAAREFTAEQLAASRQVHREFMREHGHGDAMQAAAVRLAAMNGTKANTVKARAAILHAAVTIRDEGRDGRENVATLDNPGGDPGAGKKGRKDKAKAQGPKKSKRSTGWVRHVGSTVRAFKAGFGVADERLLEVLRAGAFARKPEEVMSDPVYGLCLADDPTADIRELAALPTLGADPEYVVFAVRRDAKTGCPTHRFRYEAEREATAEALANGKANASGARIKELTEGKVTAWYRTATPQTTVFPVVYHRPTWTFEVHASADIVVDQASSIIARVIGRLDKVPPVIEGVSVAGLHRTDLRSEETDTAGPPDIASDLLLWLVGRNLGGTAVLALEESKLEWWLDDVAELSRDTADEKKLRLRLAGAPAEGGSLAAALADGAQLRSVRLALRVDDGTPWKVTLSGGVGRGWELPTLTKPDGTPAGLDSAVDERLRLHKRGVALLDALVSAWAAERADRGTWRQRVTALRQVLGIEMAKRWAFDPATGRGFLWAHMLPGKQGTFADVVVKDERDEREESTPPVSRARRTRGEKLAQAEAERDQ